MRALLACATVLAGQRTGAQTPDAAIPHLSRQGTATQLIVNGAPFLVLGGELGNSSASNIAYMDRRWATLAAMHLNTVIAPAYWEMIEPKEGSFDFRSVDALITQARAHHLRVVLLWFGSWKNSMSSYAPAWVKADQVRFPRTEATRGERQEILAPHDSANWNADLRAFRALMRHLRDFDRRTQTVIMVQVENEIGMLPEARDHSARADAIFSGEVPAELLAYLRSHEASLTPELRAKWTANGRRSSGSWTGAFGADVYTDELFMAWHFARYVERIASAGKKEYPLPMYVNAALIRQNYLPGRYVSAGPLPHLIDVTPPLRRSTFSPPTSTFRTFGNGRIGTRAPTIHSSFPRRRSARARRRTPSTHSGRMTRSASARSPLNPRRGHSRTLSGRATRA